MKNYIYESNDYESIATKLNAVYMEFTQNVLKNLFALQDRINIETDENAISELSNAIQIELDVLRNTMASLENGIISLKRADSLLRGEIYQEHYNALGSQQDYGSDIHPEMTEQATESIPKDEATTTAQPQADETTTEEYKQIEEEEFIAKADEQPQPKNEATNEEKSQTDETTTEEYKQVEEEEFIAKADEQPTAEATTEAQPQADVIDVAATQSETKSQENETPSEAKKEEDNAVINATQEEAIQAEEVTEEEAKKTELEETVQTTTQTQTDTGPLIPIDTEIQEKEPEQSQPSQEIPQLPSLDELSGENKNDGIINISVEKEIVQSITKADTNPTKALLVSQGQGNKLRSSYETQNALLTARGTYATRRVDGSVNPTEQELVENGLLAPSSDNLEQLMEKAQGLYKEGKTAEAQQIMDKISELNKQTQVNNEQAVVLAK